MLSASATIVRNLKTRNVRPPAPIRTWRKNTGPLESSLIITAKATNTGNRSTIPVAAATRSNDRLRNRDEPDRCGRGRPTSGHPLDRVELRVGSEHFEHSRNDVDLNVRVLHGANHSERLIVGVGGECDRDAMDSELTNEPRQIFGRSEQCVLSVARHHRAIVTVDESHDAQAVLGMVRDLVGKQVRHLTRADDDHVLEVCGLSSSDRPARRSEQRHESNGEKPEHDQPTRGSGTEARECA